MSHSKSNSTQEQETMPNNCQDVFETTARRIADVPQDYLDQNIKTNIPTQPAWQKLNTSFCLALKDINCEIGESELDPFWDGNKTFRQLLAYVADNCNCSS
jgi:hypothetical protein